ncbi:hypothetical protein [Bacillus sinesaloumensis]|uniref:hypothetical protein n=1 Tax=Litchfieldia sinesaloumensis TaxID=1926280 RepID=UPI0009886D5C|nr:hypothetical protein [Bacillus sinesaloumensis]
MKLVRFLVALGLLVGFHSVTHAGQNDEDYGPFTIVQKEYVDLDGDGNKDIIELLARKNQYNLANEWTIKINGEQFSTYDNKQDLYQLAEMKFADVIQNGKQDILLYFQSVGSGGITGLTVLSYTGEKVEEIFPEPNSVNWFDDSKKRFSMKYTGDYQVEFIDKQTELKASIPLSEERYRDFADKDELQKRFAEIETWIDPTSDYRFDKLTKMKPQEIVSIQAVSGIAHYDVIAYYETRYVFDKQSQTYIPTKVALISTETGKKLAEKPLK